MPFLKNRLKQFKAKLEESGYDYALLNSEVAQFYLLGFATASDIWLLITAPSLNKEDSIVAPTLELHSIKSQLDQGLNIRVLETNSEKSALDVLKELVKGSIMAEFEMISHHEFTRITSITSKIGDVSPIIKKMREQKDFDELKKMISAAMIGDIGMKAAIKASVPGATGLEIAAEAEYAMKKAGSTAPSFPTISVSGPNSALPHGIPTKRVIQDGDIVLIDLGATFDGYHSDMTRTVIAGESRPERAVEIIKRVYEVKEEIMKMVKPGVKVSDLAKKTVELFEQMGVRKYYTHSLGHGVGLEIHEAPLLKEKADDSVVLLPGMFITIEPGLYYEEYGGARIEDLLLITEDGYDVFSKTPIKKYW